MSRKSTSRRSKTRTKIRSRRYRRSRVKKSKSIKRSKSTRSKKRSQSIKKSTKRSSKSPRRSKSPMGIKRVNHVYKGKNNEINSFFDRIFIINLKDKTSRFDKVTKQFHRHGVKYMQFEAVDGRCKSRECSSKKKELEKKYNP